MSIREFRRLAFGAGLLCTAVVSRPDSAAAQTPPVTQPATPTAPHELFIRESFSPKRGDSAFAAFRAAVPADEKGGECAVARTMGNGATVVTAGYPARKNSLLGIVMTFDSAGHLIRYSERRGGGTIPPPAALATLTDAQRDSAIHATLDAVRMTSISLDWGADQALAINRGGGAPTDAIIGTVKAMESLPQLGPVSERLERVRKLCGV